jgi:hypothetical protein
MEQKICEGVYFTDFRELNKPKDESKCKPKGPVKVPSPSDLEHITDPQQLSYLLQEFLGKWTWLNESTTFLLQDSSLHDDDEVKTAIDENVEVSRRYNRVVVYLNERLKNAPCLKPAGSSPEKDKAGETEKIEAQIKALEEIELMDKVRKGEQLEEGVFI